MRIIALIDVAEYPQPSAAIGFTKICTYPLAAMWLLAAIVFPGNDSLVVDCECLLRSPRFLVEFQIGHTVCDERERLFVEVQDTPRVVGERVVQFLVRGLFMHVISPLTT